MYEGFFMYWEDADLNLRVSNAGYSLVVTEDTAILHKEGGSSEKRSPLIYRYYVASGLHFLRRRSSTPLLSMAIFVATKIVMRTLRGQWKNISAVVSAVGDYRRQRQHLYTDQL